MELKRATSSRKLSIHLVLIVPYGIETTSGTPEYRRLQQVLIVPYGIETAVRL